MQTQNVHYAKLSSSATIKVECVESCIFCRTADSYSDFINENGTNADLAHSCNKATFCSQSAYTFILCLSGLMC